MSKFVKFAGMAALVVGVVVALGAISPASAREAQAEKAQSANRMAGVAHGGGFGRGLCGEAGLAAAAEALDMTADEMSTQLWGGRTLADLADEKNVDLQTVRDAVETACKQAVRDAIEQAVTDGRLSREQADWLLEGLDNGYWGGGHGFGFGGHGFGRGGFHGLGGGPRGGMGFHGFGFRNGNSITPDASGL